MIVEKNDPLPVSETPPEQKLWTKEATLLLIDLVGEFEEKFENTVKKYIWLKICDLINNKLKTEFSWLQCDTKWKSLNKTYKEIKCHNNTSGRERKKWEYFEKMDSILYRKPEIIPPATCSSSEGLKINGISAIESLNKNDLTSQPSTSGYSKKIESTMSKKRKQHASETERRHREKMSRQDEFLNQFKELIDTLKSNKKPENENDPKNSDKLN